MLILYSFQGVEKGCIGNKWVKILFIELLTGKNLPSTKYVIKNLQAKYHQQI